MSDNSKFIYYTLKKKQIDRWIHCTAFWNRSELLPSAKFFLLHFKSEANCQIIQNASYYTLKWSRLSANAGFMVLHFGTEVDCCLMQNIAHCVLKWNEMSANSSYYTLKLNWIAIWYKIHRVTFWNRNELLPNAKCILLHFKTRRLSAM